eukprot:TRINITY_DN4187_c0_g1_i2.p1 TRINITY_DN4187_c0_g1~~TRINITY_DN4187_c0_g1_i2.p1  ORF type:complete len:264 (-),score=33.21 TRINITY_DN4187_c0_g1_i2:391-1107(-)
MGAMQTKPKLVRVKFNVNRVGDFQMGEVPDKLEPLVQLMSEMELLGALPILEDGRVCGNCGFRSDFLLEDTQDNNNDNNCTIVVSKSGKAPHKLMTGDDFVEVVNFDTKTWTADFRSSSSASKPTSDLPLYQLLFDPQNIKQYGWEKIPKLAIHGHALADGKVAKNIGVPISEKITTVSTSDDAEEFVKLFEPYPYPQHNCYIRLGHGFFIVGDTVEELKNTFEKLVQPYLQNEQVET